MTDDSALRGREGGEREDHRAKSCLHASATTKTMTTRIVLLMIMILVAVVSCRFCLSALLMFFTQSLSFLYLSRRYVCVSEAPSSDASLYHRCMHAEPAYIRKRIKLEKQQEERERISGGERERRGSEDEGEIDTIICYRIRIFFSSLSFLRSLDAASAEVLHHHGVMISATCITFMRLHSLPLSLRSC